MSIGWIKLYRQIEQNEFYFAERFTKMSAWIDLLILANHKPNTFYVRGNEVHIETGQIGYSLLSLSKRWKWNHRTIIKYLNTLQNRQMIQYRTTNITTIITILNYNGYQNSTEQNTIQNTTQTQNRIHTNNNDKNVKNEKKEDITAIAVPLKLDFIDTLIQDFTNIYQESNNIAYKVINGKDRKAMGGILAYYKKQKPEANGEITRTDLNKVFKAVLVTDFKNEYLNGVSISKLNTSFNDYYLALKGKKANDITINDIS